MPKGTRSYFRDRFHTHRKMCVSYYIPGQVGFFVSFLALIFLNFSTAVMLYCRLRWILIVQLDNKP